MKCLVICVVLLGVFLLCSAKHEHSRKNSGKHRNLRHGYRKLVCRLLDEIEDLKKQLATCQGIKEGSGSATDAPTTEEPTTEAPTTEAPTTEAPTTKAPTTEAPTTEAPTTKAPTTEAVVKTTIPACPQSIRFRCRLKISCEIASFTIHTKYSCPLPGQVCCVP